MAITRVPELTITRSRPANNKAGRQVVTLQLTPGARVAVLDLTGTFKFQCLATNGETGRQWAEVIGGQQNHMKAVDPNRLIPPKWPVRPKNYEYGIGTGNGQEETDCVAGGGG